MAKKKVDPERQKKGYTKAEKHALRLERMKARTVNIVGRRVHVRASIERDGKKIPAGEIGVVKSLVDRPKDAKRSGQYVEVETPRALVVRPRSRLTLVG